ncbi:AraC family transcriptional regulator [Prevotella sp. tf2-5]|uniref:AraC family transcriptional regulator n=1 Tax=Prevotella sp. tf2-5 TaxID=1761889 RepID=UPI0008E39427|nr:two-component regulator propeller domain-containing protein [Prevotella sp. tf2-5]SFO52064.1 ligand-binding sensor domain-containing protein [Prevotella sp. tf2-5]
MKGLKKIVLILMLALPLAVAGVYLFKTLDIKDGLTSSQINCILKDGRGYMWFGTPAGLYRYDGYTFRNFQSNSKDGSSLPDSYILSIQEALDGNLWILTSAGYCIYHPQTETFERDMKQVYARMGIEGQPNVVFFDRHKNLWAAIPNKGVVAYNMQQQLLYEFGYTDDSHGVPQGVICSIGECRDGAIIVYEDGRMICCDIMHQQHTVWATEHIAQQHLRKSHSLKVFADQSDNIWLYGQGTLMMYNKSTNVWDTAIGNSIGLTSIAVDRSVNGMAGDNKGNIWIGTDRMGLLRMNVNSHEIESVQPHNGKSDQMTQETTGVQSVYVDDTDLLWIGTEKSGVAFYGDIIYKFQSTFNGDITAITQDSDGNVWYGTSDKGVIGYEGPLASQKVTCMEATTDGSVWVGSRQNGLTRIKDGSSHIFSVVRDSMKTLIDDHVNALAKDNSGNLWIATNGGLQVYNPKMDTFSSYTRENGMLSTNNITSLFYGKSNKLLIGTSEGLVILNLSNREKILLTGNSTNLKTFTNNYITQVFEDSRGLIWVGTREGLNVLNVVSDSLNYITEKQGLCNNSICGITEDRNSNMWITTSNGISRIVVQRNREEGTFGYGLYNYDIKDGLQSNEFNTGSILTKSDGTVLFGGLFGVNWVRQGAKMDQNTLPRVMLTQLFIGEEEVMVGHEYDGNVILAQALNESNKIYLKNKQNTFTIKFAAGNYNQGERLQFMYWMEGRDHDWRNGDALLHGVKFRDLGSGSYTLHVKAVSADGAVSNQERKLEINIERPWWLTWWMLTVYVIIAIIALLVWRYGYKKVKNFLIRKRTVVEELKRQREEIKTTSDELRQPMARMTTIIGNLAERERDLEGREQLNSLHFQMLQVITRISEMQTILENPEAKAESTAKDRLELNDQGEVRLPSIATAELTANIQPLRLDKKTHKFNVVFIDSNKDFINFMNAHLHEVYDFHVYDDIRLAIPDIESLKADLVICKHDMKHMTGSELCNKLKSNPHTQNVKFVLMTDTVLTQEMMSDMNITLAADDYLAKPFNVQEAVMRFNKLMGLGPVEMEQNTIEGRETRMLEGHNASMTTATMAYDDIEAPTSKETETEETQEPEQQKPAEEVTKQQNNFQFYSEDETIGDYSMSNMMDRQLMKNVEQYVLHNMSRGQISLEEMASSMGMGRVPFFHKIRSITTKTPAEVVREIRLKHACVLLTKTNINMSELAINIGFSTAENFINIFREKYGMTPLEYRLKYKK